MDDLTDLVARSRRCDGTRLTWSAQPVLPARVVAALASFVDDYEGAYPSELFPEPEVISLLQDFRERPPASLTAASQLECALAVTSDPFSAVVLLHATLRLLARGRDFRAYPNTRPMSVSERLAVGACVAPFRPDESFGGDPLGDAYHYWAMLTAGMFRPRIASRTWRATFGGLFWSAPWLMSAVRREGRPARALPRRATFAGKMMNSDGSAWNFAIRACIPHLRMTCRRHLRGVLRCSVVSL